MKKLFAVLVACSMVLALAGAVLAVESAPLGNTNFNLKVGYIDFTDDDASDLDVDSGLYLGLEALFNVAPNLYVGGEIGYVQNEGEIDDFFGEVETDLTFLPVEVNLKYAAEVNPNVAFGVGGGLSYNYVELEFSQDGFSVSEDDWNYGAQVFGNIAYVMDALVLGAEAKYQFVDEDLNNWRLTGNIGYKF